MSGRQQFGSICAEVNNVDGRVSIFAGGVFVHSVASPRHATDLIAFWRFQAAAPVSGAMIEALKWALAELVTREGVKDGA